MKVLVPVVLAISLVGCASTPSESHKDFTQAKWSPKWSQTPEGNILRVSGIRNVSASGSLATRNTASEGAGQIAQSFYTGNAMVDLPVKLGLALAAPVIGATSRVVSKQLAEGSDQVVYEIFYNTVPMLDMGSYHYYEPAYSVRVMAKQGQYMPMVGDYIVMRPASADRKGRGVKLMPVPVAEVMDSEIIHKPSIAKAKAAQEKLDRLLQDRLRLSSR